MSSRLSRAAVYAGGFLGPFGGGLLSVLIPELRHAFHASTSEVTLGITAYLVPFAALQLVSGTIGARVGPARAIRVAYVAYAAASVAAALVTNVGEFLTARALQGTANAFTTPLLLAALAEDTATVGLGRAMGTFAAAQTAGIVSAPLCGGLAALVDWRLAFIGPAVAACALAAVPLPGGSSRRAAGTTLRSAFTARTGWVGASAFVAFLAVTGLGFLVAIRAADAFGLGPAARGLLLAGFGAAGVVAGRPAGALVDRASAAGVARVGALACAVLVPLLGVVGAPSLLGLAWIAAGVGSALLWAGLNVLAVQAAPANRSGAVSAIGAFKFAGNALAPAVWLPLYDSTTWLPFAVAGAVSATVAFTAARGAQPAGALGPQRPMPLPREAS